MTMISDLPHDLVEEILSRVPSTPLKRLRPTCKKWNALSKDGGFGEKYHRKAARQPLLLMLKDFRVFLMNVEIDAPSIEIKEDALDLKVDIAEVFHCEGLLLCTTRCNSLVVWNPCLGETIWIKPKTGGYYKKDSRFALGYHNKNKSSSRSYKILRFWDNRNLNDLVVELELYDFSTGSWRTFDDDMDQDCNIHRTSCGVSLKENTYWVASDTKDGVFLLCFDFTRERFRRLNLALVSPSVVVLSLVREEEEQQQLSALHHSFLELTIELWVTNNRFDTDSETGTALLWTKSFQLTVAFPIFPYFVAYLLDEEKRVAVCCRLIDWCSSCMVYIIGEDGEICYTRVPFVKSTDKSWRPFIFNYVQVWFKSSTVQIHKK